jgi:transposase
LKFLSRKGKNYESGRYWTGKYYKWLSGLTFERRMEQVTFQEYLDEIQRLEDKTIAEEAESEEYAEKVKKSRAFRGIDYLTALSPVCETGDYRRFPNARAFMSYQWPVPPERSIGKKRRQGGIPKTGNGHVRKPLTESARRYARPNQVSKRLARRRERTDEQTIRYADKAMKRLHEKYTRMVFKGKLKQTAITAVARELAGFIWGVMNLAA